MGKRAGFNPAHGRQRLDQSVETAAYDPVDREAAAVDEFE